MNKLIRWFFSMLPLKNYIVFESVPNLSDNTKAVFDEMLLRGLDKKYKLVWIVSDKNKVFPKYNNTIYIDKNTKLNTLEYWWYRMRAKCLICCNGFTPSKRNDQVSFYLTHGTPIKSVRSYYNAPKNIDYMLVASEKVRELQAYELKYDVNKCIATGQPRNDVFSTTKIDLHQYFDAEYEKLIVWYPTFRQHKKGGKTGSKNALPILHNAQMAIELNEHAKKEKVLVVVKPHYAQDLSYIKDNKLSNIMFIDDSFFEKNKITSYEFIGNSDALITDYSSVYFDFLLCDKPIAAIWEDIEEYRANPGFAIDVDTYLSGAHKVYTMEDFERFIGVVSEGNDSLRSERMRNNEWANYSQDGKNTERVVNFIVNKASL